MQKPPSLCTRRLREENHSAEQIEKVKEKLKQCQQKAKDAEAKPVMKL